jgi:hypothetical protein
MIKEPAAGTQIIPYASGRPAIPATDTTHRTADIRTYQAALHGVQPGPI